MRKLLWVVLALLCGCGSGGAGGSGVGEGSVALDFTTRAGSSQTVLYAVELTVHLPLGVSVAADSVSGAVPRESLAVKDGAALAAARVLPAGDGSTVTVNIADPYGFAVGELSTLICRDGGGALPQGVTLVHFSARDENGAVIDGVTAGVSLRRL